MRPVRLVLTAALGVATVASTVGTAAAAPGPSAPAAPAARHAAAIKLHRGGHDAHWKFKTVRAGETLLDLTAAAPDANWGVRGDESSVVSVSVDGRYETDIVIPFAKGIHREFDLGALNAGKHTLTLHYADDRSAPYASKAVLSDISVRTVTSDEDDYLAARYTPVLYGRNIDQFGGPLDNTYSDTPLVAWHEITPATTPGHKILQFSIIWSNEDGGTNTPALMARWGRTTDIEWIYRVEVDANGNRVAGSDTYQGADHVTSYFHGRYEGDHAVLDTCTSNNNICDTVNDPMRFFLSAQQSLPANQPREYIMDTNPWTYQVTTAEMQREGKLESPADPSTAAVSDERDYLFLAVTKDTVPPGNATPNWVGVSVGVTLKGSNTVYRSDHIGTGGEADWSIQRDIPAATTVELPPGTTTADIASIQVYRVVYGTPDPGYAVHVTDLTRGFFLTGKDLPGPSFLDWHGSITLTAAAPSATVWTAGTSSAS